MVSIFTYRDERKLFALIGSVIVAALIALIQLNAAKTGKPSFLEAGISSTFALVQTGVATAGGGLRSAGTAVTALPQFARENARLQTGSAALERENYQLREALSQLSEGRAIAALAADTPGGIEALTIGFDPENQARTATLDKGSRAGVTLNAGVIAPEGVVGRIVALEPFTSTVLLAIDPQSKVPAVVQRGRWWGIATGTNTRLQLQFVSQDARLQPGDRIVTGEGRSFHAGLPLGRVVRVSRLGGGALYQSALVEPAVPFGRLGRVVVLAR